MNNIINTVKLSTRLSLISSLLFTIPVSAQLAFENPDEAMTELHQLIQTPNPKVAKTLFGEDYKAILPPTKIKDSDRQAFLDAWDKQHQLVSFEKNQKYLQIGNDPWLFPIPIHTTEDGKWQFDIQTGALNMRIRRVGRNELATIQSVKAYHAAQLEYAEKDRNNDNELEYAQKLISTKGHKDGLYWTTNTDDEQSPLGYLVDGKTPENAYYGYYYKILTAQTEHANGGADNYIKNNKMKSGFALIAWPAKYSESGILSFIMNQDGIVYEADLGEDTDTVASAINAFNPEKPWKPVK